MNANYRKIYERQASFFKRRPPLLTLLKVLDICTLVAVVGAYIALCVYTLALSEPRFDKKVLWEVCGIPAVCLSIVSFLRGVTKRPRPYEEGIEPLHGTNGTQNSFPSRHAASAFVIGGVMIAYMPPLGLAVLLVGLLILYLRFTVGWHYPSDLLCGAGLGIACSLLVLL